MRDKYGANPDSYCYPDSDVLINTLNITDYDELSEAELNFTAFRYSEYSSHITSLTEFNADHFKYLHHYLFQDVYEWAGKIRTVDISKGHTRFCTCSRISTELNRQLARIQTLNDIKSTSDLLIEITDIFCELNVIHAFREGNGRSQRFFFEELCFFLGMNISWPDISKDEWIDANINGYNGNLNALYKIFIQALE